MPLSKLAKKYKKPADRSISQPRNLDFKNLMQTQYSSHRNITKFDKFMKFTKTELRAQEEAELKLQRYMNMGFTKNMNSQRLRDISNSRER